mmetsp:Transcript_8633/g.12550  ORF Transcript_8633/g.12550 Transcript_8633/m.12550 type:complete len:90 (-) Transcript_8633:162-431(-)
MHGCGPASPKQVVAVDQAAHIAPQRVRRRHPPTGRGLVGNRRSLEQHHLGERRQQQTFVGPLLTGNTCPCAAVVSSDWTLMFPKALAAL